MVEVAAHIIFGIVLLFTLNAKTPDQKADQPNEEVKQEEVQK